MRPLRPLPTLLILGALAWAPVVSADPLPLPAADPPGAFARDRSFDMVRLELEAELDPLAHTVVGTATWTVRRLAPGGLRLDAVAFRNVSASVDGQPVEVVHGRDEFTVWVPAGADGGIGKTSTIVVRYAATPQLGLHWRGPSGNGGGAGSPDTYAEVYSQGELEDNRYWFPAYDHPDDRFSYEGRFTIAGSPKGWTVVTNSGPDLTSYLVMVAAGPYVTVAGPENAVPLRALVPPATPESWVRPVLDPLPDMLTHFATRTGVPYAWGRYDQTFVQRFIYSGMENTGSTIMHERLLSPPSVQATRSYVPSIVAHELAHQWYGDLLTARTAREMWLNEGFATFFAADWQVHELRGREGDAAAEALAAAQVDGWRRGSLDRGGLAGRWYLGGGGATHAGTGLGAANHNPYSKGAMVLAMLRAQLGEATFWAGIRDYTQKHAHSSVDTIDLQRAMEGRSGRDLGWFFQQWTELPGVPKVTTSWSWAAAPTGDGGTLTVDLKQTVPAGESAYALPVDISVDGGVSTKVWLRDEGATVNVPAAQAPGFVAIDPAGALLVDWDQQQSAAAWSAQLAGGAAYSQRLALRALAELPAAEPDALAATFADARAPEVLREGAAEALGTRRTCALLLPALRDPDERLRMAAASALGRCADRGLVPGMLARLSEEPNSDIRSAILRSAAAIDPAATMPVARKALTRRDALEPERAAAAAALGLGGGIGDVPGLLRTPADRDVRLAGLQGAVSIVSRQALGPERERLRATVARSAERLLTDLDLRGIQGAIHALRDVGDAQSAARLEALARATTLPDLRRSARDAITTIGARVDSVAPATPNEADARLDAMETRMKELEAEIERR
ncbi:aminopeptidase [Deltaproteobacteria bacterium]|nr:aminopeptidase [Deltaproteobacteria bacterium]